MVNKTNRDKYNIRNNIMKIKHLLEGAEPKLPGAVSGIQIMTPQQFVAKAGDMPDEEGVAEGNNSSPFNQEQNLRSKNNNELAELIQFWNRALEKNPDHKVAREQLGLIKMIRAERIGKKAVAEGSVNQLPTQGADYSKYDTDHLKMMLRPGILHRNEARFKALIRKELQKREQQSQQGVAEGEYKSRHIHRQEQNKKYDEYRRNQEAQGKKPLSRGDWAATQRKGQQGVAEAAGDLLGAQTRPFGGQEFQNYMGRVADREKGKTDKYKLPYIHRSSVVKYYNEAGKRYDEDQIKEALKQRPKKLLKQNEKMKHSNGEFEQFFNIGFAALVGIAVDEQNDNLVIVNTCPGAGSCKVDCFAMKGGKVQFEGPWLSDGRILTYLLNDPNGFFNQLSAEITKEENAGKKGSKGFEGGWNVTIRWHDAGDFFSPEYVDMAFKLANAHPNVKFYAYTKMGDVAIGSKPDNFIINWSEGANTAQEKKVKAADPKLERTKNSRIIPSSLFYDLLVKDEKKNLVKGPNGQWQVIPDKLPELKQRLAKEYGISVNSILGYDEWNAKTNGGKLNTPVQYNVIITPGEPDITANTPGVLSTLLLKH
jgi:hypothetical protein